MKIAVDGVQKGVLSCFDLYDTSVMKIITRQLAFFSVPALFFWKWENKGRKENLVSFKIFLTNNKKFLPKKLVCDGIKSS